MVLCLPDSWSNWNLEMLGFEKRGKPDYLEKNLLEQRREPTTNSMQRVVQGGSLARFTNRKNSESRITAIKISFSRITKINQ